MSVYVLGELNVDLILTGESVTPEWNSEKLAESCLMTLGSSSAITAAALAALGVEVYFVGVVGDDYLGRICIDQLREKGVHIDHVTIDPALKTGITVSLSSSRDRALVTYLGAIQGLTPALIPPDMWIRAEHIHFGSYYLQHGMRPHWRDLFARARESGISTSFDTGWDPAEDWDREGIRRLNGVTDYFLPSLAEACLIYGVEGIDELSAALGGSQGDTIVKMGAAGAALLGRDGSRLNRKAFPVHSVDTTGAGDSFNAGWIYGVLAGMDPMDRMEYASACGAMAVLRIGGATDLPHAEKVVQFIRERRETE